MRTADALAERERLWRLDTRTSDPDDLARVHEALTSPGGGPLTGIGAFEPLDADPPADQPPSGPMIIAPRNIGTPAPAMAPMVAMAPTTPPRMLLSYIIRPPV